MNSSKKNNILITGCNGHIGFALLKSLCEKDTESTIALIRTHSVKLDELASKNNITILKCDLTNKENLNQYKEKFLEIDTIIHLAGFVPQQKSDDFLDATLNINLIGTINLIKMCKKNSHLIFASTCEAYGIPLNLPITEEHPLNPLSYYGASKAAAEKVLQAYCKKNSIKLTILRFTSVYGPGETIKRALPNFIENALKGKKLVIIGDGSDVRDYLYIDDAIGYIESAILKSKGGIYNIATGKSVPIKELGEIICHFSGNDVTVEFKEKENIQTKKRLDYVFSVEKAVRDLDYVPNIPLQIGIAKQIESLRDKRDKKVIYMDFDGTLVDVSERLFTLHKDVLKEFGRETTYSKEDYINMKRKKTPEEIIITKILEPHQIKNYCKRRIELIEDSHYLSKDTVFPWTIDTLKRLHQKHSLFMITKRRKKENFVQQLETLGIKKFFKDIIIVSDVKENAILRNHSFNKEKAIVVGDTEIDVRAAKHLGVKNIIVLSGMRDRGYLERYQPNHIVDDISKIDDLIAIK